MPQDGGNHVRYVIGVNPRKVSAFFAAVGAAALVSAFTDVDPAPIVTLGAFVVTALVALGNGHRPTLGVLGAVAAALATLSVDMIGVDVVAAGYPVVRVARESAVYSGLLVAAVGLLAMLDHPPVAHHRDDPST